MSDDGRRGITIIAFIGSVFSPYYAWARRRGEADPLNHAALNVALYGDGGNRWAMTERGRGAVQRTAHSLNIGPSGVSWDGTRLTVCIDERSVPVPRTMKGVVRLYPTALVGHCVGLDTGGGHLWRPIAPCARIEVDLQRPPWQWTGSGYFDTNCGDTPLEDAFQRWDWCRAALSSGTAILYDVTRRDGSAMALGLVIDPAGRGEVVTPPPAVTLARSRWGIARRTCATTADGLPAPKIVRTLEDAPFYVRSLLNAPILGEPALAMHESLSLDRFRRLWVQALLPFRMPRTLR